MERPHRAIEAARSRLVLGPGLDADVEAAVTSRQRREQAGVPQSIRADYGARIVAALGRQLETRYGRGFGEKNLRRMVQFATGTAPTPS